MNLISTYHWATNSGWQVLLNRIQGELFARALERREAATREVDGWEAFAAAIEEVR